MTTIRILFLHHSVGRQLLRDGRIRDRLAGAAPSGSSFVLHDHDYNKVGLHEADGGPSGPAFPIPHDDTDPPALARLFDGHDGEVMAAREQILEYDVIAMKSCFPNSAIHSDADAARRRETYCALLSSLAAIPRQFLLVTSPPLVRLRTTEAQAARARGIATWLASGASAADNVSVFDLFDRLAAPSGPDVDRLRREYRRRLPVDSHPNARAGEEIGAAFAGALTAAATRALARAKPAAERV
jgi:hypothetical protein